MNETTTADFFDDYVEDTLDPGWALILGSLIACLLLHATLPCMVTLGSRYERQKISSSKKYSKGNVSTDEDDTSDEDVAQTESGKRNGPTRQPSFLLEKMTSSPPPRVPQASTLQRKKTLAVIEEEPSVKGDASDTEENRQLDPSAPKTITANTSAQPCFGDGLVAMFCGVAETIDNAHLSLSRSRRNLKRSDASSVSSTSTARRRNKKAKNAQKAPKTAVEEDVPSDLSQASTLTRTVLSKLHHDDVSFTEALDKYRPSTIQYQEKEPKEESGEVGILCGERAWWKPKVVLSAMDKLIEISDVDGEMMALLRAAIPVSMQECSAGFFSLLDVSLIGSLVGTEEASIFVIVGSLTWLPCTFAYGLFESLTKLVPLAIEQDQPRLAGTYLNTSMALFTLAMIPIGLFWSFLTAATFLRLGFDSTTAALAQQFAFVQIGVEWISGIGYCFHLFLDVTGHERYSTYANLVFGFLQSLAVVVQSLVGKNTLVNIGLCRAMFAAIHVLCSSLLVLCWGWLEKYNSGIRKFLYTDISSLREVSRTAAPLGVAYFLNYGEWELLTLLATALGPAEIVAWAMLGRLWSVLTFISDGIADAAGSRCVFHLISNDPRMARSLASKSHFLGFFFSLLVTSILFIFGTELSKAISSDSTLQQLIVEIFPLLGLGNVVQTIGLVSASLLGAQERAGMATLISFLGNWCITMILGSVFTFGFQIDLQGLATAVVLGLGLSSTGNSFLLLRSEWNSKAMKMSKGLMNDQQLQKDANERAGQGHSKRQSMVV